MTICLVVEKRNIFGFRTLAALFGIASITTLATGFLPLTDAPTPGGEWQPFGLPIPWKEYERGCRHILEHSSTDSSKLTIPTAKGKSSFPQPPKKQSYVKPDY